LAVAAIVVAFHSGEVIRECLDALAAMAPEAEVVVIDNSAVDAPVEARPSARLIANRENRGFAGAVNQGFRETAAECVLVMNPDVTLTTPITPLTEACLEAGIAAGQLTDASNRSQAGFVLRRFPTAWVLALELMGLNRLWPTNPWNRRYRCLDIDLSQPGPAEQPAGAFLMIRRDIWDSLGGFDEGFFPVWFEDVDFCRRAAEAGFRIEYVPSVRARHRGGHSIQSLTGSSREVYWYVSLLRYAAKHFAPGGYYVVCLAAGLAAVPRMVLGMIRERSLKPIGTGLYLLFLTGKRLASRPRAVQWSWRETKHN
jgi:GT2 family glycosyltransferase